MSLTTSLTQAKALYALLIDIEQKLDSVDTKTKQATISYSDLYNVLQDVFIIVKELGLPDDVEHAITVVHRLIVAMNSLRIAMLALNAATMTTPAGLALAGLGFAVSLFTTLGSVQSTMFMRQR